MSKYVLRFDDNDSDNRSVLVANDDQESSNNNNSLNISRTVSQNTFTLLHLRSSSCGAERQCFHKTTNPLRHPPPASKETATYASLLECILV